MLALPFDFSFFGDQHAPAVTGGVRPTFGQLTGPFWAFDLEQMDPDVIAFATLLLGNLALAAAPLYALVKACAYLQSTW